MRLLNVKTYALEEFCGDEIPEYAILSHVWESEEVTFQDIQPDLIIRAGKKKGFQKIEYCMKQTQKDNLKYCWIDTCCIDKTSSAELTEAINSMYQWYKNSKICYAYLADVKVFDKLAIGPITDKPIISSSRWFSRGWTLQELIAPKHLAFYLANWTECYDKRFFADNISEFTGIPVSILKGSEPSLASVAQRLSWASKRATTRVEDNAYCLMGLFEVHMPLLYGEGRHAFKRLQEEIIKSSDDQSIFAWTDESADWSTYRGLLAESPAQFANCERIINLPTTDQGSEPYVMTNKGLRIQFTSVEAESEGELLANLNCYSLHGAPKHRLWPTKSFEKTLVHICIRPIAPKSDKFVRVQPDQIFLRTPSAAKLRSPYLFFPQKPVIPPEHSMERLRGFIIETDEDLLAFDTVDVLETQCNLPGSSLEWNAGSTEMVLNVEPTLPLQRRPSNYVQFPVAVPNFSVRLHLKFRNWGQERILAFQLRDIKSINRSSFYVGFGPSVVTGICLHPNQNHRAYMDLTRVAEQENLDLREYRELDLLPVLHENRLMLRVKVPWRITWAYPEVAEYSLFDEKLL